PDDPPLDPYPFKKKRSVELPKLFDHPRHPCGVDFNIAFWRDLKGCKRLFLCRLVQLKPCIAGGKDSASNRRTTCDRNSRIYDLIDQCFLGFIKPVSSGNGCSDWQDVQCRFAYAC